MSDNTAATKELVRMGFEGFNARDVERVVRICAADFTLEDIPAGLTLRGPDGMRQLGVVGDR